MRRYATNQELRANVLHSQIISEYAMTAAVEVGKQTPPVKIYRMDPTTGELRLKETVPAATFRRRALESVAGKRFQQRISELQRKRRLAGQRSKAKARAARIRLETLR